MHHGFPRSDSFETPDGRLLRDQEGIVRYHGATSGATFLDHLKHFMFTLVPLAFQLGTGDGSSFVNSIGQYQTFDSRPLPNPDGKMVSLYVRLLWCKLTCSIICSGSFVATITVTNVRYACRATLPYPGWQRGLHFWRHLLVRIFSFF
jgi:hypothetical protein